MVTAEGRIAFRAPLLKGEGRRAAFSPDGRELALADGKRIGLFEVPTGRPLHQFTLNAGEVQAMARTPAGAWLALVTNEGLARGDWEVYNVREGRRLSAPATDFVPRTVLPEWAAAFSPDGERLAAIASDTGGRVTVGDEKEAGFFPSCVGVWEVSSGRLLWSEPTDEVDQAELRFGPDGKRLYWGGRGRVLGRGVGEKDGASRSLAGCDGDVTALAVSRDGARLAFAGEDRVVQLWDLRHGREDRSFRGPAEAVRHLAFSADGRTLASVEQGGRLRRWRTDRELPGLTLPTPGPNAASPQVMAVSPTLDRGVALARIRGRDKGGPTLYDLTGRGRPAVAIEGEYQGSLRMPISDDGELVALQEKRDLVLYDAATGRRRAAIPMPFPKGGDPDSFPAELAFVAQGRELLAAWVEWEKRGGPLRFQARAWGVEDGRERWAFEAPLAPAPGRKNPTVAFVSALAVGAGGRLAVGVSWFHEDREMDLELVGCVLLLDRNDPGAPRRFDVSEPVVSLAFGEAGRTLAGFATSVTSGALHLWDAEKGEPIHRHPVHAGSVWAVCFHPSEDRVVTAGADKLLRVWDSRSGVELLSLAGHRRTVTGLRFDAEGRRLASWTGLPPLSILGMDMKRSERGEAGEVRVWDAVPTTSLSPASPSPGP